jgi:hypothetical protein
VNLGRWSSEGQESEINNVIVLTVRRKNIIILCQTDTCGPCEDERSVGVKIYGSRHRMSKRTGDIGVANISKGKKIEVRQLLWQRNRV